MPPVQSIPLPFRSTGPPPGFAYGQRSISERSTTTAVEADVGERDSWNGERRCVVCGRKKVLRFCHIIPSSETFTWIDLQRKNYIPEASDPASHWLEPRNNMLMCPDHCKAFKEYSFFIRFVPQERKYVFVNFGRTVDNAQYHGKAVNLNFDDRRAPFPAIFLIHEQRVRSCWPFVNEPDDIPTTIQFQDWMTMESNDSVMSEIGLIRLVTANPCISYGNFFAWPKSFDVQPPTIIPPFVGRVRARFELVDSSEDKGNVTIHMRILDILGPIEHNIEQKLTAEPRAGELLMNRMQEHHDLTPWSYSPHVGGKHHTAILEFLKYRGIDKCKFGF